MQKKRFKCKSTIACRIKPLNYFLQPSFEMSTILVYLDLMVFLGRNTAWGQSSVARYIFHCDIKYSQLLMN